MPGLNLVRIYMYYSNAFDLISRSPATKVCLLLQINSALENLTAVLFTFTSRQILPFGFSGQNCDPCAFNNLDFFHGTMCVQAHLNCYYSGGQMLATLAQNFRKIRTTGTASF